MKNLYKLFNPYIEKIAAKYLFSITDQNNKYLIRMSYFKNHRFELTFDKNNDEDCVYIKESNEEDAIFSTVFLRKYGLEHLKIKSINNSAATFYIKMIQVPVKYLGTIFFMYITWDSFIKTMVLLNDDEIDNIYNQIKLNYKSKKRGKK